MPENSDCTTKTPSRSSSAIGCTPDSPPSTPLPPTTPTPIPTFFACGKSPTPSQTQPAGRWARPPAAPPPAPDRRTPTTPIPTPARNTACPTKTPAHDDAADSHHAPPNKNRRQTVDTAPPPATPAT